MNVELFSLLAIITISLVMMFFLQQVLFGTTDGNIIVMSSTGAMQSQITVLENMEITSLLWSCEKFNMEENASTNSDAVYMHRVTCDNGKWLAVEISRSQTTGLFCG